MPSFARIAFILLPLLLLIAPGAASAANICSVGTKRSCTAPDGRPGSQICVGDFDANDKPFTYWDECIPYFCQPGSTQSCTLANGCGGVITCNSQGEQWSSCSCPSGGGGGATQCVNSCGTAGTAQCNSTCQPSPVCSSSSAETCNGCDDDGNGKTDEGLSVYACENTL